MGLYLDDNKRGPATPSEGIDKRTIYQQSGQKSKSKEEIKHLQTMTFAPLSCCQAWTDNPAMVRFHMPFLMNLRQPLPDSRSLARVSEISRHSATTRASWMSPPAWISARVWIAS